MISAQPYGQLKHREVNGATMAYIDEGEGDPIVFQHGNPTSSYLWRNVMPHLEGLGRLVACDLIGMGGSDKLTPSGPERYRYAEQRDYLFALWESLDLGDRVILVVHDWGSALGFEWASHHPDRVQGIAYMEALVMPLEPADFPDQGRGAFEGLFSSQGEVMVLQNNLFLEASLPAQTLRDLTEDEMAHYREPYLEPGEGRRPMLSWPREIPIGGRPADVVDVVADYAAWLAGSRVPKLFVNADPGTILTGRQRKFCRTWPNQTEVTVSGLHFVQEDSPDEIGEALAGFVRHLRGLP